MQSIYKYINQLSNSQRRLIERLAKGKIYSGTQGKLIHYLFSHRESAVYQKDIEAAFGLRASTATELVSSLEKTGLLRRVQSEKDARCRELVLTELADTVKDDVFQDIDALEKQLTLSIAPEELDTWVRVTCKMLENLGEKTDEK